MIEAKSCLLHLVCLNRAARIMRGKALSFRSPDHMADISPQHLGADFIALSAQSRAMFVSPRCQFPDAEDSKYMDQLLHSFMTMRPLCPVPVRLLPSRV